MGGTRTAKRSTGGPSPARGPEATVGRGHPATRQGAVGKEGGSRGVGVEVGRTPGHRIKTGVAGGEGALAGPGPGHSLGTGIGIGTEGLGCRIKGVWETVSQEGVGAGQRAGEVIGSHVVETETERETRAIQMHRNIRRRATTIDKASTAARGERAASIKLLLTSV